VLQAIQASNRMKIERDAHSKDVNVVAPSLNWVENVTV
jgi:hypothetical protein